MTRIVKNICEWKHGLDLVTGTTGSGKSTTLAAMVDRINTTRSDHVITIEDPIEFLHRDKRSFINQREVEVDTANFSTALRAALRQDPDSSSSAKCATWKRLLRHCWPPKPATWCS